jgi:hypothetical protein
MSPKRKNTVEVLERHKSMIDDLIKFLKKHPKTAADAHVKGLDGGKNGLSFPDYGFDRSLLERRRHCPASIEVGRGLA